MRKIIILSLQCFIVLLPTAVLAQTPTVNPAAKIALQKLLDKKAKATAEIDRRYGALSTMLAKIDSLEKFSDDDKNTMLAQDKAEMAALKLLKTKVAADWDEGSLKTDRQTLVADYKTYNVFVPRTYAFIAADRLGMSVDLAASISARLTDKLQASKNNSPALQTSLTDLNKKIEEAKAHYASASATAQVATEKDEFDIALSAVKDGADSLNSAFGSAQNIYDKL